LIHYTSILLTCYNDFVKKWIELMPELPEVETIAEDLRKAKLEGRTLTGVDLLWPKTLATHTCEEFAKRVIGRSFRTIERRGKYLVFRLTNNDYLILHLRMTGRLSIVPKTLPRLPHEHLCLELDGKDELRYHDTRKFGRWYLTERPENVIGHLGPEPLKEGFTVDELGSMIKKKSRKIKSLLLDQSFLAGLGNIYVDEALWEAQLHPLMISNRLTKREVKALHRAIIYVLNRGLATQGTSLGKGKANYFRLNGESGDHQHRLNIFRKTGEPCPRCTTKIIRLIVAQRSTHICPTCQKL